MMMTINCEVREKSTIVEENCKIVKRDNEQNHKDTFQRHDHF